MPIDAGAACVGCEPCVDGEEPTAFEQTLLDLPPQTWFEAPSSHMRDVCVPASAGVAGIIGCSGVVKAWSGGAYDSVRRRMLVWGGGHEDYWGNELYGFDLRTGTWSRVTEPSVPPDGTSSAAFFSQDPLPDGQPVSRHTYDGVEFLADRGVLWAHGGSRARDGGGTKLTWIFDGEGAWSQRAPGIGGFSLATAYDPVSAQVFVHTGEYLWSYDVAADAWTAFPGWGFPPLWPRYTFAGDKTAVVDPVRGLLWVVGGSGKRTPDGADFGGHGNVLVWDIAAAQPVTEAWATTGGGAFSNKSWISDPDQHFESGGGDVFDIIGPGIDYDSAADDLVAWPNVGPPYVLDLDTKEWTTGEAAGAPGYAGNSGGTLGRWRYIAAYNVFILVNSIDENVYFYKHTSGCGPG